MTHTLLLTRFISSWWIVLVSKGLDFGVGLQVLRLILLISHRFHAHTKSACTTDLYQLVSVKCISFLLHKRSNIHKIMSKCPFWRVLRLTQFWNGNLFRFSYLNRLLDPHEKRIHVYLICLNYSIVFIHAIIYNLFICSYYISDVNLASLCYCNKITKKLWKNNNAKTL